MSTKSNYVQLRLFELPSCRKQFFLNAMLTLFNCYKKGDVEYEDFMNLLHNICEDYRKELENVK